MIGRKDKIMARLRFKDDEMNQTDLREMFEGICDEIADLKVAETNKRHYACDVENILVRLTKRSEYDSILNGEIQKNGSYIYEITSKYKSLRAVGFARVELLQLRTLDYRLYLMTLAFISTLEYFLTYSYNAEHRQYNIAEQKQNLSSIYGLGIYDGIGGVFDDYPAYKPSPLIPCDGEDN